MQTAIVQSLFGHNIAQLSLTDFNSMELQIRCPMHVMFQGVQFSEFNWVLLQATHSTPNQIVLPIALFGIVASCSNK